MADGKEEATSQLNLYQKLARVMDEIGTVEKSGRNKEQGYAYIEQGQILAQVKSRLAHYGVFIMPEVAELKSERFQSGSGKTATRTQAKVTFDIVNADKPDDHRVIEWYGESIDYSDKSIQKALTSAQKYFLAKVFLISDKEDSDRSNEALPPEAAAPPVQQRPPVGTPPAPAPAEPELATPTQKAQITAFMRALGVEDLAMTAMLRDNHGIPDPAKMTKANAVRVLKELR